MLLVGVLLMLVTRGTSQNVSNEQCDCNCSALESHQEYSYTMSLAVKPPFVVMYDTNDSDSSMVFYNGSYVGGIFWTTFSELLEHCHVNISFEVSIKHVHNSERLLLEKMSNESFLFPASKSRERHQLFSRPFGVMMFLPLVETKGLMFLSRSVSNSMAVLHTVIAAWKMLLIILLTCLISGIVIWAADHRKNGDEFPRPFIHGAFDGFWWALVTMSTVGYGDKKPESVIGRLYGMCWIILGSVLLSVFVAALTTALQDESSATKSIHGKHIGVLEGSIDAMVAHSRGAKVYEYDDVISMFEAIESAALDGAVIDSIVALHYAGFIESHKMQVKTFMNNPAFHGVFLHDIDARLDSCLQQESEKRIYHIWEHVKQQTEIFENASGLQGPSTMTLFLDLQISAIFVLVGVSGFLIALFAAIDLITHCKCKMRRTNLQDRKYDPNITFTRSELRSSRINTNHLTQTAIEGRDGTIP